MADLRGTVDGVPGRASIYCSWGSLLLLAGVLRQLTAPDERQPPALALLLYRVSGLVQHSFDRRQAVDCMILANWGGMPF